MHRHADAHLHLVDLHSRDPGFYRLIPDDGWIGAVVSHDPEEFALSETLRASLPPTVPGFGIHPQSPRVDTMEFLATLASTGKIGFIGEAGFDFFGDTPERTRTANHMSMQRSVFEFQLELAIRHALPLLIHSRKSMDLLLGYQRQLRRLPAVIFHGWPGRANEAEAFMRSGCNPYFSFGTTLLREAKHAIESLARLPFERLLSETDAPWQVPRGSEWTSPGDIVRVSDAMAQVRGVDAEAMRCILERNFSAAFGKEL